MWAYEGQELFIEVGEPVRFRVTEVRFDDTTQARLAPPFHGADLAEVSGQGVAVAAPAEGSNGASASAAPAVSKRVLAGGQPHKRPAIPVEHRSMLVLVRAASLHVE